MFERYTERARRALFFARYEASQLGGRSIETEHMLLGLIREGKGITSRLFVRAHISLADIRQEVERRAVPQERTPVSAEIPFSAEMHGALQDTVEEADRLGHAYIGTEHLLLGLLRAHGSTAASILSDRGMQLEAVRANVDDLLQGKDSVAAITAPPHIVLVQVRVRPELLAEFEAVLLHNARESLAKDPGCLRFDVSQHADDPTRWILHEVYTNPEAHAAHRQSPHFLACDEVAKDAVIDKSVVKAVGRHLI
jgi:ATP-dependent Clp protease ATP-binding subunit ClpC